MIPRPMLATPADSLPVGPEWTYEVKWDGYRVLAVKTGSTVRLISRKQKDLTPDYPVVVGRVAALRPDKFVLDGEIVALTGEGRPSFQALQHRTTAQLALVYYAFDLLSVDGVSWMRRPIEARRERLAETVAGSGVLLSSPLPGPPAAIEAAVRALKLEGVVAKRRGSLYEAGQRSDAWIKVKFSPRQEFVIGGYKPYGRSLDSIVVGYYDGRQLLFAAQVRAGLTPHIRAALRQLLDKQSVEKCPFVNLPNSVGRSHWGSGITAEDMASFRWVRPREVVEVSFVEWTNDHVLRHPRFMGLRSDKSPRAVHRET